MKYIGKNFFIEGVKVKNLAKKFQTPIYCYSYRRLKENIRSFKKNFKSLNPIICFAVKANANLKLLKEIKKFNLGADVVSIGELTKALKAGIQSKKIVFSGVGKTSEELNFAISKKILLINVESKSEILEIEKIAKRKKKTVNIGIRLNPNTDPKTLSQISTGKKQDKFGVTENIFLELVKYVKNCKFIKLKCISVHIGSQILNHQPYEKMLKVVDRVIKKTNYKFEFIDLGGGMGISYGKKIKNLNYKRYVAAIKKVLKRHKAKIIFEPGRSIVGDAGLLLTKIIYIKEAKKINFVILDAAMNDLMRPALYGSKHRIIPGKINKKINRKKHEFVGPICETTDKFLSLSKFQSIKENDILAICDVGAYGMVLSSNYNLRTKPAEILVNKSSLKTITKRQKLNSII